MIARTTVSVTSNLPLPNGVYTGVWLAYSVNIALEEYDVRFKVVASLGIRIRETPCYVKIVNGVAYITERT